MYPSYPNNIALPLRGRPPVPQQSPVPQQQHHQQHNTMVLPVRHRMPQGTDAPAPTSTPQQSQSQQVLPTLAPPVHSIISQNINPQHSLPLRPSNAPSRNEVEPRDRLPNRNGQEPATVCFGDSHLRRHEYHHLLDCGHEIYTPTRQQCGANCALKKGGSVKAPAGKFACPVVGCAKKLRDGLKAERGLFVNRKAQGLRKCILGSAAGKNIHEALNIRTIEGKPVRDAELKGIATPVESSSTRQLAVTKARERSLSPDRRARTRQGYRERESLMIVDKPSIQYPQTSAAGSKEKTLFISEDTDDDEDFDDFAKLYESTDKVSAAQGVRDHMAQTYPSVSNRFAFDFSMRPDDLHDMARERGADMNRVDGAPDNLPHAEEGEEDAEIEDKFDIQETHCICASAADGLMVECSGCHLFFHPVCMDKGQADLKRYKKTNNSKRYRAMREDVHHFSFKEVFRCSECDDKAAPKAAPKTNLTVAERREKDDHDHFKRCGSDRIYKFSPQYSIQQRVEMYKLWERDQSQLAEGERLSRKTKQMLDEMANRKVADEREQEENRANDLFKKVKTVSLDAKRSSYRCDFCDAGIRGHRYECRQCKYDLCKECRENVVVTYLHQCGDGQGDSMNVD